MADLLRTSGLLTGDLLSNPMGTSGGSSAVVPYNYPSDITGLEAWWSPRRSDGYTAAGGFVSQLNDLSGNGHTLTQATGAKQPGIGGSYKIGTEDALNFDGADDLITGSSFISALSAKTIFMVTQAPSRGVGLVLDSNLMNEGSTSSASPIFRPFVLGADNGPGYRFGASARNNSAVYDFTVVGTEAVFDGVPRVLCYADDGSTVFGERDGIADIPATTFTKGTKTLTTLSIGALKRTTESLWYKGMIGDVIVYNRVLSSSERARVVAMLQGWYMTPVKEKVHLFLMMGQSNCAGRGTRSEIAAANAAMDTYYGTNPTDLFIYDKVVAVTNGLVLDTYFNNKGMWYRLDAAFSDSARTTTQQDSAGANATGFGVELQYAYEYSLAHPGVKVFVIKAGFSSASMDNFDFAGVGDASNWKFTRDYLIRPALADMAAIGYVPSSIKVFWMQGEAESPTGTGITQAAYQAYLDNMRTAVVGELRRFGLPIKFVIGGLSAHWDGFTEGLAVKAAQSAWCAISANTAVLHPTDGTGGFPAVPVQGDFIHYTTAGLCDPTDGLGKRVFNA